MTTSAYVPPLDYPGLSNVHLPEDVIRAIGHVTALWAQLGRIIDSTLRQILDLPGAPEIDTALILPFRKRLALLNDAGSRVFSEAGKDGWLKTLTKVGAEASELQRSRDIIAHGVVAGVETTRDGERAFAFQRIRWDRPVRVLEARVLTVAEIERIAMAISDTVALAGLLEILLWATTKPSRDKDGSERAGSPNQICQATHDKLARLLRSSRA
jgi:hypothetical protein